MARTHVKIRIYHYMLLPNLDNYTRTLLVHNALTFVDAQSSFQNVNSYNHIIIVRPKSKEIVLGVIMLELICKDIIIN